MEEEDAITTESSDDPNVWIVFGVAVALMLAVAAAYHYSLPPKREDALNWKIHAVYWILAGVTFAIPTNISQYIFSSLSVTFIGTVFPIYESLRAICTPDEDDDKYWLQYYLVGGLLFICTQFVDEWLDDEAGVTYWFQAMFFLYLWLYFPKTDGAAIIYDKFTEPCLAPRVKPLTAKLNTCFSFLYQTGINACHICLAVLFFVFFPKGLQKVIAVAVGTAYPWMSSVTAATTEDVADDTYWLTYWACYSCLFLLMELLETWLGWIPGFYSVYILATVYLMLPMFQGAEKVFRKLLVPLARLQDLLILRDAIQIKKRILSELDPEQARVVRRAIVDFYADEDDAAKIDESSLKRDLLSSWKGVQMPGFSSLFRKKGAAADTKKNDDNADDAAAAVEDEPVTNTDEKEEAADAEEQDNLVEDASGKEEKQ